MSAAARSGDLLTLQAALDCGMSIDARNADDLTPLMEAARAGRCDSARFLLRHGASMESHHPLLGSAVALAARNSQAQLLALLLRHGADPNAACDAGLTPLMLAALSGEHALTMSRQLIGAGAEVNARSRNGWTALLLASDTGEPAVIRLLLTSGAESTTAKSAARAGRSFPWANPPPVSGTALPGS